MNWQDKIKLPTDKEYNKFLNNLKKHEPMKTKKRYIIELTEAEIGYVSMALENTQTTLQENSYSKRILPILNRTIEQVIKARQNGMKTVKK